jgi:hypothetical protein
MRKNGLEYDESRTPSGQLKEALLDRAAMKARQIVEQAMTGANPIGPTRRH